jgi:hypothetical protein
MKYIETIEQLTHRVNVQIKKIEDGQISAARNLEELKKRVQDKNSDEGEPWHWSWHRFALCELEFSYQHAQRLIGYLKKDDPVAAVQADREAAKVRMANSRAAQKFANVREVDREQRPDPITEVKDILAGANPIEQAKAAWRQLNEVQKNALVDWIILQIEFSARAERLKNAKAD